MNEAYKIEAKILIICFTGTACVTFSPPVSKIFIDFPVPNVKNLSLIMNYQFNLAAICQNVYGYTRF